MDFCPLSPGKNCIWQDVECFYCLNRVGEWAMQQIKWSIPLIGKYFKKHEYPVKCERRQYEMDLNDVMAKYPFGAEDVVGILDAALQCATIYGLEFIESCLNLYRGGSLSKLPEKVQAQGRIAKTVCEHPWTWEGVDTLSEKVAPRVDYLTFKGLLA